MTPEQITKWAVEVGMNQVMEFGYTRFASPAQLQTFAQLVRNEALEEAAVKCEEIDFSYSACEQFVSGEAAFECGKQIRSMKK